MALCKAVRKTYSNVDTSTFAVGYLGRDRRPVIAFGVKPLPSETSGAVVARAKRIRLEAWARLSL